MSHLGDRVTALVDDALDDSELTTVQQHLEHCEQCREAVRRERHLKSRMSCGSMSPAPPPALVAALADRRAVADHVARQERRRRAATHAVVTAGGLCASLTVLGLCMGGSSPLQARQAAVGPSRAPQPVAAWVSGPSAPGTRGAMMGARSGSPAPRPPLVSAAVPAWAPWRLPR